MSDLVSSKSPSGSGVWVLGFWVLGSGVLGMPVGLTQLTQHRVLGQGEGVYPKKSLQWTRGLVNRGETMHLLLLSR